MSVINEIEHKIMTHNTNDNQQLCNKHITIIPKIDPKISSVFIQRVALLDPSDKELDCISCHNNISTRPMAFSTANLRFVFILGDLHSYLKDGYTFIIEYKYGNHYEKATYKSIDSKWKKMVDSELE